MKKSAAILLLLLTLSFSTCYAWVYDDRVEGIKFEIPGGFARTGSEQTQKIWTRTAGDGSLWTVSITIVDCPGELSDSEFCEMNFSADSKNKKDYSTVERILIKNARGAYLVKEKAAAKSDIYRWYAKVFGNGRMYLLMFAGTSSNFDRFLPAIQRVLHGMELQNASGKLRNR
jgi:hypothetical protein